MGLTIIASEFIYWGLPPGRRLALSRALSSRSSLSRRSLNWASSARSCCSASVSRACCCCSKFSNDSSLALSSGSLFSNSFRCAEEFSVLLMKSSCCLTSAAWCFRSDWAPVSISRASSRRSEARATAASCPCKRYRRICALCAAMIVVCKSCRSWRTSDSRACSVCESFGVDCPKQAGEKSRSPSTDNDERFIAHPPTNCIRNYQHFYYLRCKASSQSKSHYRRVTCKAAENDCLEGRESIRPCIPSRVAYKAEWGGNELP